MLLFPSRSISNLPANLAGSIFKYIQNQPLFPSPTTSSLIQASVIFLLEHPTVPAVTFASLQSVLFFPQQLE